MPALPFALRPLEQGPSRRRSVFRPRNIGYGAVTAAAYRKYLPTPSVSPRAFSASDPLSADVDLALHYAMPNRASPSTISRILALAASLSAAAYVGVPAEAAACSCVFAGGFLQVAPKADLVVIAKVLAHEDNVMTLKIQRTLKGSAGDSIRVFGDNGKQCRPYISMFPIGTTWVFAVSSQRSLGEDDSANDYSISICGRHYLRLDGNSVSGAIQPAAKNDDKQSMPLPELVKKLAKAQVPSMEVRTAADLPKAAESGALISISGTAQDAKSGAVIVVGQVPVYIDRMESWSAERHGSAVKMTGHLVRKKHIPDPVAPGGEIAQGAWGDQYVLTDAKLLR